MAKAADHVDAHPRAGDYLTEGKRLVRVLADIADGIEVEDERTGTVFMLTMASIKAYWRVVTPMTAEELARA